MRTDEELEVLFKKFDKDVKKRGRFFRFLLALDQMFNVLLWNGSQDETISSHIGRRIANGKANKFDNVLQKILQKIEKDHCKISVGE